MRFCDRCIGTQKTCCQESPKILLTQGDVRRITLASGCSDFFTLEQLPEHSQKEIDSVAYDPNWLRYVTRPDHSKRLLKMNSRGNCIFLEETGCILSEDARPLICRLYPYIYNEFGMIGLVFDKEMWCPIHLLEEGETLADMLQLGREQTERWRMMLYEELRADYNERETRTVTEDPVDAFMRSL